MTKNGSTVVIFKDDSKQEVFLVYRSDWPIWTTTSGAVEKREEPFETAIREAYEETGFEVEIKKYLGVYKLPGHKSYLFEGRVKYGEFRPEFPGCKGKWFAVDDLPFRMIDRTKEKIIDAADHQGEPFIKKAKPLRLKNNWKLALCHPFSAIKYFFKIRKRKRNK
jgi:8-oxo-dGTP pyrophosphatase MutT (NUDIX family)